MSVVVQNERIAKENNEKNTTKTQEAIVKNWPYKTRQEVEATEEA